MKRLDHYWYRQNPVAWLLLPLSLLFCSVAMLRRYCYLKGWLARGGVSLPVVVVGNISVGGTGKTPLIIGLCDYLRQHDLKPGVISRGYGATTSGEHDVAAQDDASIAGDEPLLIKRRTGCPVVIGRDRVAAARKLVAEHDCDVVLSDDGMQHYRLRRDIEIAVVDSDRRFGNGFCLPAGPLRETQARLGTVDIVVYHGDINADYHFSMVFDHAVNLFSGETKPISAFCSARVHAVAGIGHPQRFFEQLREHGLSVIAHAFPDHHRFIADDIVFADRLPVLMTEKDAVKCAQLQTDREPEPALDDCWYVPAKARLSSRLGPHLVELIRQRR